MSEHVLVPVDGSDPSRQAVEYAVERFPEARLTLLYAMNPVADYGRRRAHPGYRGDGEFANEREKGEYVIEQCGAVIPDDRSVETDLSAGDPGRAIVDYADEHDVDAIVIGSHGRRGPARYLLGSVAETVVRRAGVPVTVVRTASAADG